MFARPVSTQEAVIKFWISPASFQWQLEEAGKLRANESASNEASAMHITSHDQFCMVGWLWDPFSMWEFQSTWMSFWRVPYTFYIPHSNILYSLACFGKVALKEAKAGKEASDFALKTLSLAECIAIKQTKTQADKGCCINFLRFQCLKLESWWLEIVLPGWKQFHYIQSWIYLDIARKGFYSPGSSFVQSRSLVPDRDGKTLEDLAPKASLICSRSVALGHVHLNSTGMLVLSLASVLDAFFSRICDFVYCTYTYTGPYTSCGLPLGKVNTEDYAADAKQRSSATQSLLLAWFLREKTLLLKMHEYAWRLCQIYFEFNCWCLDLSELLPGSAWNVGSLARWVQQFESQMFCFAEICHSPSML